MGVCFSLSEIERIVWECLEEHPCTRPTMSEVATIRGVTALQIRRTNQRIHRVFGERVHEASFRDALTYSCVTYARRLITQGTKVEAAMRLAGFHQKTNFNRQCREFFAQSPRDWRPDDELNQAS